MNDLSAPVEACSGCGLAVAGGDEGCNALFQELTGRSFTDLRFGRVHRMVVDIYALQHPDRYCVSAKSLAAHLCGLCDLIERGGDPALPNMTLRRWLDGAVDIAKPDLPADRGTMTIADINTIDDPAAFADSVRKWGNVVWAAYAPLHAIARAWLDRALAEAPAKQRHGRQ
jgi:hypothetical protein